MEIRDVKPALALAMLAGLAGCAPGQPFRTATGFTAHVLCSETYVTGQDPDRSFAEYVAPSIGRVAALATRYRVDRDGQAVEARFAGLFPARAVTRAGRGCTLVQGGQMPAPLDLPDRLPVAPVLASAPAAPVPPDDPRIAAALDRAFAEAGDSPDKGRRAIVIVRHGRILAERYAPGIGPDTRLPSWSMAKSVTNALIGLLVAEGQLALHGPAPVPAWAAPEDPRHAVSIDMLLRQSSGQPFGSANSGLDRATRMLFQEVDMAGYAAAARFKGRPGAQWSYTDGNYAILSGILRDRLGGAQGVADFARRHLFAPAGMASALQEFDLSGAPMGATHVYATARDWARFGLLYLNDGRAGGRQVLPQGWAAYSARPTAVADQGYGAGFWTNRGNSRGARLRRCLGMPQGSYFASGHSGQTLLILPEQDMVLVSLGFSTAPDALSTARAALLVHDILGPQFAPEEGSAAMMLQRCQVAIGA